MCTRGGFTISKHRRRAETGANDAFKKVNTRGRKREARRWVKEMDARSAAEVVARGIGRPIFFLAWEQLRDRSRALRRGYRGHVGGGAEVLVAFSGAALGSMAATLRADTSRSPSRKAEKGRLRHLKLEAGSLKLFVSLQAIRT